MTDKGQLATTGIDSLVSYLKAHGETDSSTLAIALNVGEPVIEKWANTLEKANLIKISYRLGKMFISVPVFKAGQAEAVKKIIETKQGVIAEDVTSQLLFIKNIENRISALSSVISSGEEAFRKNWRNTKRELDELNALERRSNDVYKRVAERKEHVNKSIAALDKELTSLREIAAKVKEFDTNAPETDRLISDVRNRASAASEAIETLPKRFDEIVRNERRRLEEFIAAAKESLNAINNAIGEQEKLLSERKAEIERYRKEAERISAEMGKNRSRILDEVSLDKQEIDKLSDMVEAKAKHINETAGAILGKFGDAAKLNTDLANLNGELEKAEKEKNDIENELHDIEKELSAIRILSAEDLPAKGAAVENYSKKVKETGERVSKLGEDVANIDEQLKKEGGNDRR